MQRAIAVDGVEWNAADMSFDQDGRDAEIKNRTQIYSGVAGLASGGVLSSAGGLNLAVSGPLKFTVNGELGIINAPANIALGANDTWYIVARYLTTDSNPATYYGSGSPPNKWRTPTPAIVARNAAGGGAANSNNNEVNLGTVVTGASSITSITDTRIIVPSVVNGSILLGGGATIDGMDPSVHQALQATPSVLGHVLLGAPGGAATYESVGSAAKYWIVDAYIYGRSSNQILDESDFTSPPGGVLLATLREMTLDGSYWREGYGPEYNIRCTLNFSSSAGWNCPVKVLTVDDSIRVKLNGSDVYSHGGATVGLNASFNLPIAGGANVLKLYFANGGASECRFQFLTDLLRDSRITFNPL